MPNPKVGTVTIDVAKAVEESKAGKVEYRTDRTAIVHLVIGKRSFEDRQLLENYAAVIEELVRAKPSAAKGRYLHPITLASTMGPGRQGRPGAHARYRRGGARGEQLRSASPHGPPKTPGGSTQRKTGTGALMNRDQKAAAIDALAGEHRERRGDLRGRLPRHHRRRRSPSCATAARRRRHLPRRQELADRARGRPGRSGGAEGLLQGPTALTFVRGDAALAAKAIADYAARPSCWRSRAASWTARRSTPTSSARSRGCPSREVLYGQLVGVVASPVSGLVRTLNALIGGLAVALGQVREQKESGEIAGAGCGGASPPARRARGRGAAAEAEPARGASRERARGAAARPRPRQQPEAEAAPSEPEAERRVGRSTTTTRRRRQGRAGRDR